MNKTNMKKLTLSDMEDLQYSQEYAEYIMKHSSGDRVISNGDTLCTAMEDAYLFEDFLADNDMVFED